MSPPAHRATRRQDSAAQTRQLILDAARELFAERGYSATTVQDVAARAGVAVATVYTSVGGKPTLATELIGAAVAAPEAAESLAGIAVCEDPAEVVRLAALGTRLVNERSGTVVELMVSASVMVPEISQAAAEAVEQYRGALRMIAERLAALSALRPGLTAERAADILWFYFGLYAWRQLSKDTDWSFDEAQEWLRQRAMSALLAP
ncbi:MAG: helix-turn-helix transcriptional regulator [Catenulispora sp.]|nr:helix-turn-helix transcriptional regulator [Catenulispora sp.]